MEGNAVDGEELQDVEDEDVRKAREEQKWREIEAQPSLENIGRLPPTPEEALLELNAHEAKRAKSQRLAKERIVAQLIGKNTVVFNVQEVVTLRIPDKMRLVGCAW